jgi:Holliday junction resolvasome RuvABC endonuclease subunit
MSTVTFIAIDPGTTNVGISIWGIDSDTLGIQSIQAFTFNAAKMTVRDIETEELHGLRFSKLLVIRRELLRLFKYVSPLSIACESPFYFFKRPGAFAPLVETLFTIKLALFEYDYNVPFITYDPSSIKNSIKASGAASKETMKNTMMDMTDLPISKETLSNLDEHSIDAIAVGYCHYYRYILGVEKSKIAKED